MATTVHIAYGRRTLSDNFFAGTGILRVVLPGSMETIDNIIFPPEMHVTLQNSFVVIGNSILGYSGNSEIIEIPSMIGGREIRYIRSSAFESNYRLQHVIIPSTIRRIEHRAFRNTTALHTVTFKGNSQLLEIDSWAFAGTVNLMEIEIPPSVVIVGEDAFRYSGMWNHFSIGNWGGTQFAYELPVFIGDWLVGIRTNPGGIGASIDVRTLIHIVIRGGITIRAIADGALRGVNFNSIVLPNTVEIIGWNALPNNITIFTDHSVAVTHGWNISGGSTVVWDSVLALNAEYVISIPNHINTNTIARPRVDRVCLYLKSGGDFVKK